MLEFPGHRLGELDNSYQKRDDGLKSSVECQNKIGDNKKQNRKKK